jgi:hypothetical protein
MIIAACLEGGVTRLYSEDFDAYPQVDGLEVKSISWLHPLPNIKFHRHTIKSR